MMKNQTDSKVWLLVLTLLPAWLCADGLSDESIDNKTVQPGGGDEAQRRIERLERDIKTTKIKHWVIQKKNEKLISRQNELESRIEELRKTLKQQQAKQEDTP